MELRRNKGVVNDLDVGQEEEWGGESGGWGVRSDPGGHAHQLSDNGPHQP